MKALEKIILQTLQFIPRYMPLEKIEPIHMMQDIIETHTFHECLAFIGTANINSAWIKHLNDSLNATFHASSQSNDKDRLIEKRHKKVEAEFNLTIKRFVKKRECKGNQNLSLSNFINTIKEHAENNEGNKYDLTHIMVEDQARTALNEIYIKQLALLSPGWLSYLKSIHVTEAIEAVKYLIFLDMKYFYLDASRMPSPSDFKSKLIHGKYFDEKAALLKSIRLYEKSQAETMLSKITTGSKRTAPVKQHFVFCIDARSNAFRKRLNAYDSIATHGYAGFLGLSFCLKTKTRELFNQKPTILKSEFQIQSINLSAGKLFAHDFALYLMFALKRISIFSLKIVEALGPYLLLKLFHKNIFSSSQDDTVKLDRNYPPSLVDDLLASYDIDAVCKSLAPLLQCIKISTDSAQKIILVGHESTHTNNAFKRSLQCGACSGNSSYINNYLAARLLNDDRVRAGLKKINITLHHETVFEAALHETTKNKLILRHDSVLDNDVKNIIKDINNTFRHQRLAYGAYSPHERSNHWGCIMPDPGLVKTHFLIFSSQMDLIKSNIRDEAFLHDYDNTSDPDAMTLSQLLDGPGVVASFIHSHYYFALLAPTIFCSGSKTIHSAIDGIGVQVGSTGKLGLGLPDESIRYLDQYMNYPCRLTIICEANRAHIDKAIQQTSYFKRIYENGWVHVEALTYDIPRQANTTGDETSKGKSYQKIRSRKITSAADI